MCIKLSPLFSKIKKDYSSLIFLNSIIPFSVSILVILYSLGFQLTVCVVGSSISLAVIVLATIFPLRLCFNISITCTFLDILQQYQTCLPELSSNDSALFLIRKNHRKMCLWIIRHSARHRHLRGQMLLRHPDK